MTEVNETLSRPAFQRYELAPILVATTHALIERAEKVAPSYFSSYQPLSQADMNNSNAVSGLSFVMEQIAETTVLGSNDLSLENELDTLLSESYFTDYTFYQGKELLEEGFKSGLVMPIKLYGLLVYKQLFEFTHIDSFEIEHFEGTVSSEWFNNLLHQLADLPNGNLEQWSTSSYPRLVINSLVAQLSYEELDSGGFDFDAKSKELLRQTLAKHNAYCRKMRKLNKDTSHQESGGCPGRHSTFKRLGENALVALGAAGVDIPKFQEEARDSIITISRNFVVETVKNFFYELYIETNE